MPQQYISKGKGKDRKVIPLNQSKGIPRSIESFEIQHKKKASPSTLEKQAWDILNNISKVTNVDQLLLSMKKYSGLIGNFSPFNALLIQQQDPDASIVRSKTDWKYWGRELKDNAKAIDVLYPVGIPRKTPSGKVKEFIEEKRKEGLDDEAIDKLIQEKFHINGTEITHTFGTGSVYDISQTFGIPGKEKPEITSVKASKLYSTLKDLAKQHFRVEEGPYAGGRGYTAHSGDGETMIKVMKVPGEDENSLHTLIHEMSHANLKHLDRNIPRGIAEAEAELSTYLVGEHYGFNFKEDSSAYIKGWLDNAKSQGKSLGKENIDRVMNNARWIINQVSGKLEN